MTSLCCLYWSVWENREVDLELSPARSPPWRLEDSHSLLWKWALGLSSWWLNGGAGVCRRFVAHTPFPKRAEHREHRQNPTKSE